MLPKSHQISHAASTYFGFEILELPVISAIVATLEVGQLLR